MQSFSSSLTPVEYLAKSISGRGPMPHHKYIRREWSGKGDKWVYIYHESPHKNHGFEHAETDAPHSLPIHEASRDHWFHGPEHAYKFSHWNNVADQVGGLLDEGNKGSFRLEGISHDKYADVNVTPGNKNPIHIKDNFSGKMRSTFLTDADSLKAWVAKQGNQPEQVSLTGDGEDQWHHKIVLSKPAKGKTAPTWARVHFNQDHPQYNEKDGKNRDFRREFTYKDWWSKRVGQRGASLIDVSAEEKASRPYRSLLEEGKVPIKSVERTFDWQGTKKRRDFWEVDWSALKEQTGIDKQEFIWGKGDKAWIKETRDWEEGGGKGAPPQRGGIFGESSSLIWHAAWRVGSKYFINDPTFLSRKVPGAGDTKVEDGFINTIVNAIEDGMIGTPEKPGSMLAGYNPTTKHYVRQTGTYAVAKFSTYAYSMAKWIAIKTCAAEQEKRRSTSGGLPVETIASGNKDKARRGYAGISDTPAEPDIPKDTPAPKTLIRKRGAGSDKGVSKESSEVFTKWKFMQKKLLNDSLKELTAIDGEKGDEVGELRTAIDDMDDIKSLQDAISWSSSAQDNNHTLNRLGVLVHAGQVEGYLSDSEINKYEESTGAAGSSYSRKQVSGAVDAFFDSVPEKYGSEAPFEGEELALVGKVANYLAPHIVSGDAYMHSGRAAKKFASEISSVKDATGDTPWKNDPEGFVNQMLQEENFLDNLRDHITKDLRSTMSSSSKPKDPKVTKSMAMLHIAMEDFKERLKEQYN